MASSVTTPPRSGLFRDGFDLGRMLLEGRAFFALIAIIAVFSFLSPYYFSVSNFLIMSSHVAIYGILAIGMLLVILNGGIDLSVGSTLGLAGVVAGFLMQGVTLNALGVVLYPPCLGGRGACLRARCFCRVDQRHPDRALQGAGFRRDAWCHVCGARFCAVDDQWPDLQQSWRQGRVGQYRVRLAWLQSSCRHSDRRRRSRRPGADRQRGAQSLGLRALALFDRWQ